ncbi:MAG: YhbY family RNA-binding protein [Candidatus Pacearchaeota archaeon]
MKTSLVTFQIGKKGLTENFIQALEKTFKKHELVKIAVLKSTTRDRIELKEIAERLCFELKEREKKPFTAKIIGFTIFIRKWRKLKE